MEKIWDISDPDCGAVPPEVQAQVFYIGGDKVHKVLRNVFVTYRTFIAGWSFGINILKGTHVAGVAAFINMEDSVFRYVMNDTYLEKMQLFTMHRVVDTDDITVIAYFNVANEDFEAMQIAITFESDP